MIVVDGQTSGAWSVDYQVVSGGKGMSKEQKSNKEAKKKPLLTAKEKKAAKKSKKENKGGFLDHDKTR